MASYGRLDLLRLDELGQVEINCDRCPGVCAEDPDCHLMELITAPYRETSQEPDPSRLTDADIGADSTRGFERKAHRILWVA